MSRETNEQMRRRHFLTSSSASIISAVLLTRSAIPKIVGKSATSNALQAQPADALSVGYLPPNAPHVQAGPADRESLKDRWIRRAREATDNSIPEHPIRNTDVFPPEAYIKPAKELANGESDLVQKGVSIFFAGLYTNDRQWNNKDAGSFLLRVKFDEQSKCSECPKVSSVTVGSTFEARSNNIAGLFSAGIPITQVKIAKTGSLKIGLDLVDIGDPRDKSAVEKAIQVANTLAPLTQNGIAQLVASTAGAFIEPASQILEAFGIEYLKQDTKNRVLWSSKAPTGADVDINLVITGAGQPKLRRGTYFIGGLTRNSQPPAWGSYFLRAADRENAGEKNFLYRRDTGRGKVIPADFTYVTLMVEQAEIPA